MVVIVNESACIIARYYSEQLRDSIIMGSGLSSLLS